VTCTSLPDTGGVAAGWLIAGVAFIVLGFVLLRRSRPRHSSRVAMIVLVVIAAGCVVAQPSTGQALAGCEGHDESSSGAGPEGLVIEQSSVIDGLEPLGAPIAINGTVTNVSDDSTYVTQVTVSIATVVKAPGAPAGRCSAYDYVLRGTPMRVDLALPARSSVPFAGAALGFNNRSVNQDACKGATVHLHYVSGSR
jgi:LPXTG-motif cell wall-anchored protein